MIATLYMQGATLGNTTVLVNNVDPVMLWEFDSSVAGCNQWAADYVTELLALGVRTAEFVCEFQGFIFIANVIMDGVRIRNRILWSDFNAPTHGLLAVNPSLPSPSLAHPRTSSV